MTESSGESTVRQDDADAPAETFFSKMKRLLIGGGGSGGERKKKKVLEKTSYHYGCCFFTLLTIFIFSTLGCMIMWFTDIYLDSILNQMTLKNGTEIFKAWEKPPVKPLICVYVFNYTNMENYTAGVSEKIEVKEAGPYCYRETLVKTNVKFYDNGTVSYGDRRTHVFQPQNSSGKMDDMLIVPNLPLIGTVGLTEDFPFLLQKAIDGFLQGFDPTTMIKVRAHDFIFGYNDKYMSFINGVSKFLGKDLPFEKFGILAMRAAETQDRITVRTGADDLSNIGEVTAFNGQTSLSAWDSPKCNRVDGSDGAFFPRREINRTATLYLFHKDLCRKLPLVYQEEVDFQDGVMGMRFHAPANIYNTTGTCYCKRGRCPPVGVFDLSPCSMGMPLMMSFPHFMYAESSVTAHLEGLRPDPKKHEFYLDIQPILGFTLGTVSRVQLNIQVRKSHHASLVSEFAPGTILPVVWLEVTADRLPPDLFKMIYHASVTVQVIQWSLQWGLLVTAVTSGLCTLLVCHRPCERKRHGSHSTGDTTSDCRQKSEDIVVLRVTSI